MCCLDKPKKIVEATPKPKTPKAKISKEKKIKKTK